MSKYDRIKSLQLRWPAFLWLLFTVLLAGCADSLSIEDEWQDRNQSAGIAQKVDAGDRCASGCVWSTFAVAMGAQSGSATCNGQPCECVVQGDIWRICAPQGVSSSAETSSSFSDATAGARCDSGCIWSTFAVSIGAQDGDASCDGRPCACVVDGDVWSSCSSSDGGAEPAAQSSYETSPTPNTNVGGQYNANVGNRIADAAYQIASWRNTVGYCYSAAADAIESVTGPFLWGSSAYMAADQLRDSPWFYEVSVGSLLNLPAGAVVVWGRGGSPHGHISIALGDGREASDHVTRQMTYHYGGAPARVFFPQ